MKDGRNLASEALRSHGTGPNSVLKDPNRQPVERCGPPEPLLGWGGHARCRRKVSQLLCLFDELTAVDDASQEGMHHRVCPRSLWVAPLPGGLLAQRLQ